MTPAEASVKAAEICRLAPVVPVLVIEELAHAKPLAQALVKGGLPALEVTLRTQVALDVIRAMAHEVLVMYLGRPMEVADRDTLYERPLHPYTQALLSAVPVPEPRRDRERILLNGDLPSPQNPPSGCVFRTRCPYATEKCAAEIPVLVESEPGHGVACHYPKLREVL